MSDQLKIQKLEIRLKLLETRNTDHQGVSRKINRQIRNLKKKIATTVSA